MATHKPLLHDGRAASFVPSTETSTFVPKGHVGYEAPWVHRVAVSPTVAAVTKPTTPMPTIAVYNEACPPPTQSSLYDWFARASQFVRERVGDSARLTVTHRMPDDVIAWTIRLPGSDSWRSEQHAHRYDAMDDLRHTVTAIVNQRTAPTKLDVATPAIVDRLHEFATTCASVTPAEVTVARESNVPEFVTYDETNPPTDDVDRAWFNHGVALAQEALISGVRLSMRHRVRDDAIQFVLAWQGTCELPWGFERKYAVNFLHGTAKQIAKDNFATIRELKAKTATSAPTTAVYDD